MSALRVLGSADPVVTSEKVESSDRDVKVIEVEGPWSLIENAIAVSYCPSGYEVESSNRSTTGDGMGKLTVRCVGYSEGLSFSAVRTTFRVDMLEVQIDLHNHPHIASARKTILKWLATDESKRYNDETDRYCYTDVSGSSVDILDEFAIKFCNAYVHAGIRTFNRYYPVIERTSVYKNPPGLSRSGTSFSGGSPDFSDNVGKFNSPPISLNGFASGNFFKSKDSWVENADKTWTRTEQWTYTPEGSSGSYAWIYNELTQNENASSRA